MQYSDVSLRMNWTPTAQSTVKRFSSGSAPWYHITVKSSARSCNPKSNFSIERAETLKILPLKFPPCSSSSSSWFVRSRFCQCLLIQLPECRTSKIPFCLVKILGLRWATSVPVSWCPCPGERKHSSSPMHAKSHIGREEQG